MNNESAYAQQKRPWLPVIVTLLIVAIGVTWAAFGLFKYGVWQNRGPGAGFFPVVAGSGAFFLGLIELFRKQERAESGGIKSIWPALGMALAIASIPLFGMVIAMSIFVMVWMALIESQRWWKSLLTGLGTGIALYLLFGLWLRVAFPQGIII